MARSLKDANRWPLAGALIANVAIYYVLTKGIDLQAIPTEIIAANTKNLLPVGLGAVLCGFLNSQLSALHKARIVFLRWRDPLPGCRAFSKYAANDLRISMEILRSKWAPIPKNPAKQNALWYRLYKQEEDSPAVLHLNKSWLLARDYACLSLLLLVALGLLGAIQMPNTSAWLIFSSIVSLQFILARRAAITHAERLVTTVIAQAAARST